MITIIVLSAIGGFFGFPLGQLLGEKVVGEYLVWQQRREFRAYWEGTSNARPARQEVSV